MKILITGVFGFVGNSIFFHLKKKFDVLGIGRKKNFKLRIHNRLINKKVTKTNLINLNFLPDIILHCAGSSSVIRSYENKKLDFAKNVETTKEIVKFIQYCKIKPRIVFFSSAAVYGNNCNKNRKKTIPISPYGKNKLLSEKILLEKSKKFKFKINILRFYSIYGCGLKKQLIWDACRKMNNQKNIYFGTGNEIRSWINIKDVIRFIDFLIKKNIKKNTILDISGNDIIKNKTLLQKLFKLNKLKSVPNFNNINKKGDPLIQIFNNSKLKKLNWFAKTKLSDGLLEYLLWFKKKIEK